MIGQLDVYQSLLNIMGCYDYYFMRLGKDVFFGGLRYVSFGDKWIRK